MKTAQQKNPLHEARCNAIELRIQDLMDSRQPLLDDAEIQNHISTCDQCAELVVDYGAIEDSLSQVPVTTVHRLSQLGARHELAANRWWTVAPKHQPIAFFVSVASLLLVLLTASAWTGPGVPVDFAATPVANTATDSPAKPVAAIAHSAVLKNPGIFDQRTLVSLDRIVTQIEPLNGYLNLTGDLPGIRPVRQSVHATYQLIRESMEDGPSKSNDPNEADRLRVQSLAFFVCAWS